MAKDFVPIGLLTTDSELHADVVRLCLSRIKSCLGLSLWYGCSFQNNFNRCMSDRLRSGLQEQSGLWQLEGWWLEGFSSGTLIAYSWWRFSLALNYFIRPAGLPCREVWIIQWILFWVTDRHQGSGGCILGFSTLFDKFQRRWNGVYPLCSLWFTQSIPAPVGIDVLGMVEVRLLPAVLWRVQKDKFQVLRSDLSFWETYLKNAGHSRPSLSGSGLAKTTPVQKFEDFEFGVWTGHSDIFRLSPNITNNILNDRDPNTRHLCAFKVVFIYVLCRQFRVDIFIQDIHKFARYVIKCLIFHFSNTCTQICLHL